MLWKKGEKFITLTPKPKTPIPVNPHEIPVENKLSLLVSLIWLNTYP